MLTRREGLGCPKVRQIGIPSLDFRPLYMYTYQDPLPNPKSTILSKRYDSWSWPNYFWSRAEILVGSSGKVSFSNNHNFSGLGGDDYILYINHECMHVYGSNGCSLLAARLCSFFARLPQLQMLFVILQAGCCLPILCVALRGWGAVILRSSSWANLPWR